ncbi:MAG: XdhC family protein [Cyanobacteria bacterium]|nr:XdhC family protein [Cyanobacteriota bacterium]
MKESIEILELFTSALCAGSKMAMVTVVDVRGSAYRRSGAHLLLTSDGRRAGSVSAGCLENDILARGEAVFELQSPLLLEYSSDEFFGLNYGCDGTIQVIVQTIDCSSSSFPQAYSLAQETGQPVGLATVYACDDKRLLGSQVLFIIDEVIASDTATSIVKAVVESSRNIIDSRSNCNLQLDRGKTRVFCEVIHPSARLAIFGAGDDVIPLINLARSIGIESHIIDTRRSYLERFRSTEICHHYDHDFDPSIIVNAPEYTAIVIMGHNFELDKRFLSSALETECGYIGVMGSRKRTMKMLAELGLEWASNRIRFPIGLDLGAESPEEIALSICSEILSFFRNASGKPLATLTGPIHQRVDAHETGDPSPSVEAFRLPSCVTGGELHE